MKLFISCALTLFISSGIYAQKDGVGAEAIFKGNAEPIKLSLPRYPKEAKNANLGGRISVEVVLDKKGHVISADKANGPYPVCQAVTVPNVLALRQAATAAAKKSTFKITTDRDGVPTKGLIAYDFVLKPLKTDEKKGEGLILLGSSDSNTGYRVNTGAESDSDKSFSGFALPKTVSGGVLNHKAMTLPKPSYPAAARAVKAAGTVNVQVLILEDGSMYSAQVVSGHPLLRAASEIAACGSRFSPTLLSDQPVKVSGVITYNFVP